MASLQSYVATTDDVGVQLHLYTAATIHTGHGTLEVDSRYPWDGRIRIQVRCAATQPWTLALRVPAWCEQATVAIDGVAQDVVADEGYLRLTRAWGEQTTVVLELPMPVRLVGAHPRVDAVRDCAALMRGPLVYSIEQADLPEGVVLEDVVLDIGAAVDITDTGDASLPPVTLSAQGFAPVGEGPEDLYGTYPLPPKPRARIPLTAIPYFYWGNRQPGAMRVWIPAAEGEESR